ncbi:energy transducer TonB [Hymenobacter sp. 102]|uniref:energy transducer TonB n=1 Tax=Hymenobacter sp. 102 TaxID=3403152 RepID=UPI003CEAC6C1
MLPLPILNVRLQACSESWQHMTPTAQGRHCRSCSRTVIDFTEATQPELEAAFQASPDGRVCGRFRAEQLAPDQPAPLPRRVALRPRLRKFLVALLLVCGLGLSAREAVGQLLSCTKPNSTEFSSIADISAEALHLPYPPSYFSTPPPPLLGIVVEQMPEFKGGRKGVLSFLEKNLHYPKGATSEGRVFVMFTVAADGRVKDASIVKGLEPLLDQEVLRVIKLMPAWQPGSQQGRAVDVRYTLPVTFSLTENE